MADAVEVQVIGADEALAQVEKFMRDLPDALQSHMSGISATQVEQLAGVVPYLTGALSESARAERPDQSGELYALMLGGEDVPYAGWIEFGGSRGREFVPEGRYMEPTAVATQSATADAISRASQDIVNGYPWITPST